MSLFPQNPTWKHHVGLILGAVIGGLVGFRVVHNVEANVTVRIPTYCRTTIKSELKIFENAVSSLRRTLSVLV